MKHKYSTVSSAKEWGLLTKLGCRGTGSSSSSWQPRSSYIRKRGQGEPSLHEGSAHQESNRRSKRTKRSLH